MGFRGAFTYIFIFYSFSAVLHAELTIRGLLRIPYLGKVSLSPESQKEQKRAAAKIGWPKIKRVGIGRIDGENSDANGAEQANIADGSGKNKGASGAVDGKLATSSTKNQGAAGQTNDEAGPFAKRIDQDVSSWEEGEKKNFWMPICFFIDPAISENMARNRIKDVVDKFAKCDIAVDVLSTTIKRSSYAAEDPGTINNNALAHCNAPSYYGMSGLRYAAQTHTSSDRASDKMCAKNAQELADKAKRNDWSVAGCAQAPGQTSIVDRSAGVSVATHELGHNVGHPGRGGGYLENEGEGGFWRRSAGQGLQGKNTPDDPTKRGKPEPPEGTGPGMGNGFNAYGCLSLQAGANDNSKRQLRYFPKFYSEYYQELPQKVSLNFGGRKHLFLEPGKWDPSRDWNPKRKLARNQSKVDSKIVSRGSRQNGSAFNGVKSEIKKTTKDDGHKDSPSSEVFADNKGTSGKSQKGSSKVASSAKSKSPKVPVTLSIDTKVSVSKGDGRFTSIIFDENAASSNLSPVSTGNRTPASTPGQMTMPLAKKDEKKKRKLGDGTRTGGTASDKIYQ